MKNTLNIEEKFSARINQVPRSFIRDILKATAVPNMISFAGGLPNPKLFPVKELEQSTIRVLNKTPNIALQYGITQGLNELREKIAGFYKETGLTVTTDQILITTGSQQALDLIGKTFLNSDDYISLEEPSYLGAIQAFSMYSKKFATTPLNDDGINIPHYEKQIIKYNPKITYVIPNFQNPTGRTYSINKRKIMAEIAIKNNALIVEDDPYGKISFDNLTYPPIYSYAPNNTILLGSFSKILAPGFRLGWIVASKEIINKIEIAKQASDLHTSTFSQAITNDFLQNNNVNEYIQKIRNAYKIQAEAICDALHKYFPKETHFVEPKGGMFTWLTLPQEKSSMQLFNKAVKHNISFVPGTPFYINKTDSNTLRLNYSCLDPFAINQGIKILSKLL